MKRIHTQIEIDAPASRIWEMLTDFARYPEWNPFILEAQGIASPQEKLRVRIKAPTYKPVTFKPKVVVAADGKKLCWLGRLGIPGLFDGQHCFELETLPDGKVRFTQSEDISGILTPFMGNVLEQTRRGFEFMNEALKRRAESPDA